ncbi:MAG: hypothetical protein JO053_01525 [Acidobacteria bacterium]|nr:hypothetical protein [Acidobacteriota bacterium]
MTATMRDFILEDRLSEAGVPRNLVLDGTVPDYIPDTVTLSYYWRWLDQPDMHPQFLADGIPNTETHVPFELQGRAIIIYQIGRTDTGDPTDRDFAEAEKIVFGVPTQPTLVSAVFSSGHVTLTIAPNNGTGTIHVYRQLGTDDYVEIGTAAYNATSYTDTPSLNGTYNYKLIQDALPGESNVKSATVTGGSSPAGSPPTGLGGSHDGVHTTSLTWTNHGGTGVNSIERKTNVGGTWAEIGTVSSGTASYSDVNAYAGHFNRTYYYRVRNMSVSGYTNELDVFVPADPGENP